MVDWPFATARVAVVLALGVPVQFFADQVPAWAKGTGFGTVAESIELPVDAILLGLLAMRECRDRCGRCGESQEEDLAYAASLVIAFAHDTRHGPGG